MNPQQIIDAAMQDMPENASAEDKVNKIIKNLENEYHNIQDVNDKIQLREAVNAKMLNSSMELKLAWEKAYAEYADFKIDEEKMIQDLVGAGVVKTHETLVGELKQKQEQEKIEALQKDAKSLGNRISLILTGDISGFSANPPLKETVNPNVMWIQNNPEIAIAGTSIGILAAVALTVMTGGTGLIVAGVLGAIGFGAKKYFDAVKKDQAEGININEDIPFPRKRAESVPPKSSTVQNKSKVEVQLQKHSEAKPIVIPREKPKKAVKESETQVSTPENKSSPKLDK